MGTNVLEDKNDEINLQLKIHSLYSISTCRQAYVQVYTIILIIQSSRDRTMTFASFMTTPYRNSIIVGLTALDCLCCCSHPSHGHLLSQRTRVDDLSQTAAATLGISHLVAELQIWFSVLREVHFC